MRHLTSEEKATVRQIVDGAGVVEVIRLLAQIVANDTEDLSKADEYRAALMTVARHIGSTLASK